MASSKDIDKYQWQKFMEHWGCGGLGIILVVCVVAWLFLVILNFFLNLSGAGWLWLMAGSFTFMLTGAALIIYAKLPAYRNGRFFSFGVKSVPVELARHYQWGWRMFWLGVGLSSALLLSVRGVG